MPENYISEESVKVLNNAIKVAFSIVGAVTGYTLTRTIFAIPHYAGVDSSLKLIVYTVIILFMIVLFYFTSNKFIDKLLTLFDKVENYIQNMSLYEMAVSALGMIVGLIIANLVTIPINRINIIGVPLSIAANILFGVLGVYATAGKRNEAYMDFFRARGRGDRFFSKPKIVDTSVLIDGRLVDIIRTGFIEGELIVPGFVLVELRHIADSTDVLKRNRGRRGLDVLNVIQKEIDFPVIVDNSELPVGSEVDNEILKLAKKYKGEVLTTDYNLNKVASVHNIPVLNINELANAVKPIALPGEDLKVQVIKDGKENGQGIGYMDDGTMIVVDGGRNHMNETIDVTVTSVLQTSAGRMIFAKPKLTAEKVM